MNLKKSNLYKIIDEEILKVIKEFIEDDDELQILSNAANDLNRDVFDNRGKYDPRLYQLTIRDTKENVLEKLQKKTSVKKVSKGFAAKDDEEKEYYQLPDYNIAISFDQYKVSRSSIIQILDFNGILPKKRGFLNI